MGFRSVRFQRGQRSMPHSLGALLARSYSTCFSQSFLFPTIGVLSPLSTPRLLLVRSASCDFGLLVLQEPCGARSSRAKDLQRSSRRGFKKMLRSFPGCSFAKRYRFQRVISRPEQRLMRTFPCPTLSETSTQFLFHRPSSLYSSWPARPDECVLQTTVV